MKARSQFPCALAEAKSPYFSVSLRRNQSKALHFPHHRSTNILQNPHKVPNSSTYNPGSPPPRGRRWQVHYSTARIRQCCTVWESERVFIHSPSHCPSALSSCPGGHCVMLVHLYEPSVFSHLVPRGQEYRPVEHSSRSSIINTWNIKRSIKLKLPDCKTSKKWLFCAGCKAQFIRPISVESRVERNSSAKIAVNQPNNRRNNSLLQVKWISHEVDAITYHVIS